MPRAISNSRAVSELRSIGGRLIAPRISSRAPEKGEAQIEVPVSAYEGQDIEIGFNPTFISDALKVIVDPQVILELKAPNKPGLVKSGNDLLYVVMPVNLQ